MSRRALWAPRQLDSFDWRAALIEERQPRSLPFAAWSRPNHDEPGNAGSKDSSAIALPSALVWVGLTVAGMSALVFVLSGIYSRLASALTGFAASPGLPVEFLGICAFAGLLLGLIGMVLGSNRRRQPQSAEPAGDQPDNPVAA